MIDIEFGKYFKENMYSNYGSLKLSTQSKVFVIYQKKVVKSCTFNKNLHVSQKKKKNLHFLTK